MRVRAIPLLAMLGAALLALALPQVLPVFYVHIMVLMVIIAIFAMSLDILMGYAGLPSLGHAAFYGMGAYVAGLFAARYGGSWWEGVLLATTATTALGALFGLVALRTRGLYFMLITLALAQVMWGAVNRWGSFTGGYNGLRGIPKYLEVFGGTVGAYYLVLMIGAVLALVMWLIVRSPFGLSLQGIRDSESRMQALGYNVWLHKYAAFVLSAVFAGFAGIMSAYYKGFVSPFDLSIALSVEAILIVILGGTGTLFGPIIGAVIIVALRNFLGLYMNHWLIVLGLIFIATVFLAPNGVISWLRPRRRPAPEPETEAITEAEAEGGRDVDAAPSPPLAHAIDMKPVPRPSDGGQPPPDLELRDIVKSFGGMTAVRNVSLQIKPGDRVAILGPNGAGKTSLFHIVSGALTATSGQVLLFGRDVSRRRMDQRVAMGLGRTFQITNLFATLSVLDNLRLALLSHHGRGMVMYRFAESYPDINVEARGMLEAIGLWEVRDIPVKHLSYGHQRQLEVILAVALRPRLLLLDEPTAGLSAAEQAAIVALVRALDPEITLLIIEHDMDVAFAIANKVMVFHHGEKLAEGTNEEVRSNPQVQRIYLGAAAEPDDA